MGKFTVVTDAVRRCGAHATGSNTVLSLQFGGQRFVSQLALQQGSGGEWIMR